MIFRRTLRRQRAKPHVLYLVSHPIQYQSPLLRLIHASAKYDFRVGFTTRSTTAAHDAGFGHHVEYDVPLLDGYSSSHTSSVRSIAQQLWWADVVWLHGWTGRTHMTALALACLLRRPVLMRSETWAGAYPPSSKLKRWLRGALHHLVDHSVTIHLTVGTENEEYWASFRGSRRGLVRVPYAVDNARFGQGDDHRDIRDELGLRSTQPLILYCGKMSERKHPDVLLQAFKMLPDQAEAPVLLFVGDGELRTLLEYDSRDYDNVRFFGFANQSDLPEIYAACDVFVLAASNEPWGLAVNEAMASGTAVIASDQVGAATDLVDSSVGRVVVANDADALCSAIVEVLEDSEELGENAVARISQWGFSEDLRGLAKAIDQLSRAY